MLLHCFSKLIEKSVDICMASLLSDAEKAQIKSDFSSIHDSFARDIVCYKDAEQVVISTDPNYNPLYGTAGQTTSIVNTPVYQTFKARIFYKDDFKKDYFSERELPVQMKIKEVLGTVRIKVDASAYSFLKDCKRFDIDGSRYVLNSEPRPHGILDVQYYSFYLKPDL